MGEPLRVLQVEDELDHAKLAQHALRAAGLEIVCRRVETSEAFLAELAAFQPDIVLSDYHLPGFDGLSALRLLRERAPETPFILVTGALSDETAVACLKAGATDYLLKERLSRLAPAVRAALDAARQRVAKQRTEQALAASEARWRGFVAAVPDAVFTTDAQGRVLTWNAGAEQLFGYSADEMHGQLLEMLSPERDRASVRSRWQRANALPAERLRVRRELVGQHKQGYEMPLDLSLCAWSEAGQRVYGGLARDLSPRHETEAQQQRTALALNEERERAQRYFELAGVLFLALDDHGHVTLINRRGAKLLGYETEELIGRNWFETCMTPKDRAPLTDVFERVRRGEVEGLDLLETSVLTRSGEERTILWQNTLIRGPEGEIQGTLSAGADVTDRRRAELALHSAEEQLRQAQKLESLGTLAGGVAHDFNNLLAVILGQAELLHRRAATNSVEARKLGEVIKAAQRGAGLTRQLLAFSRRQVLRPRVLDPNEVVRELTGMLARLIGEDIHLKVTLGANVGHVRADPGQVEQVLMNLAVNARDAMPAGGDLHIETMAVGLPGEAHEAWDGVPAGPHVAIRVSDTGMGMDAATQARIFEPFFTTKPVGKGTGLGLSTTYGIVTQSGGHVVVNTAPGEGAAFTVYLPRISDAIEGSLPARPHPARLQGREKVLVVEDEESARELVVEVLSDYGYEVLSASSGKQALDLLEAEATQPIDLLLTDVVMPGMNGHELAQRLAARWPRLSILFTSGYTADVIGRHGMLEAGDHFIEKPFTPSALAAKVRVLLDRERGGLALTTPAPPGPRAV